jgi:exopolysaccharide production protein ExoQ
MNPQTATVLFAAGIIGLFVLDRDPKVRTSRALWIPVAWLWIAASRNVSEWVQAVPPVDNGGAYLEGSAIDRYVLTALLVLGLAALLNRQRRIGAFLRANVPIILFFLYCGVSVLWSEFPAVAFKRWIRASGDIVMVFVVLSDHDPLAAFRRFIARAGFVLIPLSILLIRYYPDLGRGYGTWDSKLEWTGVTTNKNLLGMICLIFGLASAWRLIEMYRRKGSVRRLGPMIAHSALLLLALELMIQADSATSIACLVMAGSVMVITSRPAVARKRFLVYAGVSTVLLIAFSALFLHVGTGLIESLGRDSTLTGRDEIWTIVLRMAENPLFGTGYESFWVGSRLERIWSVHGQHFNQAHNGYIEVYLNLGLVGVALLTTVLAAGFRKVVASVHEQDGAASLMLAYFVVGVAYNFTEGAFKMMHPVWIVLLLAITVVPKRRVVKRVLLHDIDRALAEYDGSVASIGSPYGDVTTGAKKNHPSL